MKISISTSKAFIILIFLLSSVFLSASYSIDSGDSFGDSDYYSIPEYDSHGEIFSELAAPFIFITVLLQLGLNKALQFTLAENDNPYRDNENSEIRRNSTIMSLIIVGMMVPTPIFDYVQIATTAIFGSVVTIFLAVIGYTALIMLKETF